MKTKDKFFMMKFHNLKKPMLFNIAVLALITGTVLYVFYYHQELEVTPSSRLHHSWTDSNDKNSSIPNCTKPSWEIKVKMQYLAVRSSNIQGEIPKITKRRLVLLWTKYFGSSYSTDYYFFREGNVTFTHPKCRVNGCRVTNDRSTLRLADAVIFHQWDIHLNDLPSRHSKNQLWIFYNLESPGRLKRDWAKMERLFNWTMSYREDSSVKAKYGEVCRIPESVQQSFERDYLHNKTREVAWFVSDCHSSSNREGYVRELSQHISVDVYGMCGTKKCSPAMSKHCYEDVLKEYKFYLSFENSICRDYVTEKLFNVLNADIIPVVLGGADYERIAPPRSYINAFHYPNPKDLADYLKKVGGNYRLYNSYFEWKRKYKTSLYPWMCDLCEKLHLYNGSFNVVENVFEWWAEKAQCMSWDKGRNSFVSIGNKLRV